ncbi:MAG: hypothetical protein LC659_02185 [Myxococcales bacterium]|nr:hypothetical protein [Myxococcales bacterium]
MRSFRLIGLFALCTGGMASSAGCSLLLDRGTTQCKTDDDCTRFGGHPLCQEGVCVPSGLGPEGCFVSAASPPYRAFFLNASSCAGVISVFDSTKRLITNPAAGATPNYAFYFDDSGNPQNCLLDSGGNSVDIGVSNLFAPTCNSSTATYMPGTTVSDYTGAIVPFALSVPAASTQMSISAEAAHIVFGMSGKSSTLGAGWKDATPWTDPTYYFIRNSSAGSTVLSAVMFNVPKTKFWGIDRLSTDNLRDSMLASTAAEASIGILSIVDADVNRGNIRSLYLQSPGQISGYLPDSNKNSFDKMNVRDGHYPLWGYEHFFTPIGAGGVPSDAAKAFVTRFAIARLDPRLLDNIIAASLVPQCAMKVVRSAADMGSFSPNKGLQCGCYFDYKTTGKNDCKPCASSSDCPSDHSACNYGYCEAN